MEQALKEFLKEGEEILWSGKSEAFPLLDKQRGGGKKIVIKWIVVVILTAALLLTYSANNDPMSPTFVLIVLAIAAILILSPVMEQNSVMGARYWITNQHIILMLKNKSIFSMRLESMDGFRVVQDEAPNPCLVIGSHIFCDINKQLRWRCCHPLDHPSTAEDDNAQGIVFYNVKDSDQAEILLKQYAPAV